MKNRQSIIELGVLETNLIGGGWDGEFRNKGCRDPDGQKTCITLCRAHVTYVDPHHLLCINNCYLAHCTWPGDDDKID